ncbi:nucleolar and coiled-body phosphoprotein 1-like [Pollicipes pollicipes]|uniref:nucleolar and coiled-body phosphoprotein 1-like n=1 Tax=Pollicipes pollicipes TaxID=41117 RepID=UPI001884E6F9|nr:nucleolar and coiled-body phosphoprotein 1-like [Pollicipes pollicipes]
MSGRDGAGAAQDMPCDPHRTSSRPAIQGPPPEQRPYDCSPLREVDPRYMYYPPYPGSGSPVPPPYPPPPYSVAPYPPYAHPYPAAMAYPPPYSAPPAPYGYGMAAPYPPPANGEKYPPPEQPFYAESTPDGRPPPQQQRSGSRGSNFSEDSLAYDDRPAVAPSRRLSQPQLTPAEPEAAACRGDDVAAPMARDLSSEQSTPAAADESAVDDRPPCQRYDDRPCTATADAIPAVAAVKPWWEKEAEKTPPRPAKARSKDSPSRRSKKLHVKDSISRWAPRCRRSASTSNKDDRDETRSDSGELKSAGSGVPRPRSLLRRRQGAVGYHSEGYFSSDQDVDPTTAGTRDGTLFSYSCEAGTYTIENEPDQEEATRQVDEAFQGLDAYDESGVIDRPSGGESSSKEGSPDRDTETSSKPSAYSSGSNWIEQWAAEVTKHNQENLKKAAQKAPGAVTGGDKTSPGRAGALSSSLDTESYLRTTEDVIGSSGRKLSDSESAPAAAGKAAGFARSDGGRFSLRMANGNAKTPPSRPSAGKKPAAAAARSLGGGPRAAALAAQASRDQEMANWKRRKNYDPLKAAREDKKKKLEPRAGGSQSDSACPTSAPLRSASFHGTDGFGASLLRRGAFAASEDESAARRRSPLATGRAPPPPRADDSDVSEVFLDGASAASSTRKVSLDGSRRSRGASPLFRGQASSSLRNKVKLEALDNLVISTIHTLSSKIRGNSESLVSKLKCQFDEDDVRHTLLDDVMTTLTTDAPSASKTSSRDLAGILKNLRKVEQAVQVLEQVLCDDDCDGSDADDLDVADKFGDGFY